MAVNAHPFTQKSSTTNSPASAGSSRYAAFYYSTIPGTRRLKRSLPINSADSPARAIPASTQIAARAWVFIVGTGMHQHEYC
jgi:hypothetical protein